MSKKFKKIVRQKYFYLLLIVLLSAVSLRLWRLPDLFHFTYDEEIIAFVGKRIFINHHIPLIGGVTPMHVHLAPYFYWFSALWLGLSNLQPIGWGVVAAGISVCTLIALFTTGQKLFNRRIGILATIFYTFSFSQNVFDRHYWGLSFNGLFGLLTILSLHELLRGKWKYSILLAVVFFAAFHSDPSTLILYLLVFTVMVITRIWPQTFSVAKAQQRLIVKAGLMASAVFLVSLIPLVVFDLRHNFSNSKGILLYLEEIQSGKQGNLPARPLATMFFLPQVLSRALFPFGNNNLATLYSYCPQYAVGKLTAVPVPVVIVVTILIGIALYQGGLLKAKRPSYLLLLVLFGITLFGIITYGIVFRGDLFDHYIVTLLPPFYLLIATLIDRYWRQRFLIFGLLLFFVSANLLPLYFAKHRFGYSDKIQAVQWIVNESGKTDFSLDAIGDCFRYNGYRYLFFLAGKEPVKSYVDANFTHLYDYPPAEQYPPLLFVIVNSDPSDSATFQNEYQKYRTSASQRILIGNIEILKIDNQDLKFTGKF